MPDIRRLGRQITPRSAPRIVAHLAVAGLVLAASALGLDAATGPTARSDADAGPFFGFVTPARGAATDAGLPEAVSFRLDPANAAEHSVVDRSSQRTYRNSDATAAKPTPVPVDPNATPLPAPTAPTAQGQVQRPAAANQQGGGGAAVAASGALAWPVPGGAVSQGFHGGHLAIDIAASSGSTVVAADNGVVTFAGWRNNGGGLVVAIDHGNGMKTVYNHLGSIWVGPGQAVARGQGIAGVGCTGICTGPHVHFEVIVNGYIQNPQAYY